MAMDFEILREWLSTVGSLLIGVGTFWLACTGQAFRKDKHFENKFNLAKEAIRIFNHLRNDIQQIRSPVAFEGELSRLKALVENNELIKKMKTRTNSGITLLRMDERGESLAEMNRLEPEFSAVFGKTKAFNTMRDVRHKVWVAAMTMCNDYETIIWSIGSDDPINQTMDEAVTEIEQLCNPVLRGKRG